MTEENPEGFNYQIVSDANLVGMIRIMALKDSGYAIAWALLEVADAIRRLSDMGEALFEIGDVLGRREAAHD